MKAIDCETPPGAMGGSVSPGGGAIDGGPSVLSGLGAAAGAWTDGRSLASCAGVEGGADGHPSSVSDVVGSGAGVALMVSGNEAGAGGTGGGIGARRASSWGCAVTAGNGPVRRVTTGSAGGGSAVSPVGIRSGPVLRVTFGGEDARFGAGLGEGRGEGVPLLGGGVGERGAGVGVRCEGGGGAYTPVVRFARGAGGDGGWDRGGGAEAGEAEGSAAARPLEPSGTVASGGRAGASRARPAPAPAPARARAGRGRGRGEALRAGRTGRLGLDGRRALDRASIAMGGPLSVPNANCRVTASV